MNDDDYPGYKVGDFPNYTEWRLGFQQCGPRERHILRGIIEDNRLLSQKVSDLQKQLEESKHEC